MSWRHLKRLTGVQGNVNGLRLAGRIRDGPERQGPQERPYAPRQQTRHHIVLGAAVDVLRGEGLRQGLDGFVRSGKSNDDLPDDASWPVMDGLHKPPAGRQEPDAFVVFVGIEHIAEGNRIPLPDRQARFDKRHLFGQHADRGRPKRFFSDVVRRPLDRQVVSLGTSDGYHSAQDSAKGDGYRRSHFRYDAQRPTIFGRSFQQRLAASRPCWRTDTADPAGLRQKRPNTGASRPGVEIGT